MKLDKNQKRQRRHIRIRTRLEGTGERPRLVVFRSLKKNYAQLIDDLHRKTLVAVVARRRLATTATKKGKTTKVAEAKEVGRELAKKALEKGITTCVFDRNGYKYHGRVKALADGAREGGLRF